MSKKIDPISLMQKQLNEGLQTAQATQEGLASPTIIPTGVLEPVIWAVAKVKIDKLTIVLVQCANKLGKTAMAINILKNIFWENDPEYFGYPIFEHWPFSKQGRIVGTVKNTADLGPIRTEILKWWPKGRYASSKNFKSYHSEYKTDTAFCFDIMTYQQDRSEFEGPLEGWQMLDEPPKPDLMGAITSRYMSGGLLLLTMTPINAGIILDTINDFEEKGAHVERISGTLFDNDIKTGKLNSKGTKRGLMTKVAIDDYIARTPIDQREPRVYGKATVKTGKIYPMFNRAVHVKDFDLDSAYAKEWNCYCILDPHPKYYPFIQWWGVTPDGLDILYNEWPNKLVLGDSYYDEVRTSLPCAKTPKEISRVIKILDATQFGLVIRNRFMDPHVSKKDEYNKGKKIESFQQLYAKENIIFNIPPSEKIDVQRETIRDALSYETTQPINEFNQPTQYYMPHCVNSIRAVERHHYDEDKETEAETFKDPMDCNRYFKAAKKPWRSNKPKSKKAVKISAWNPLGSGSEDVSMG